MTPDQAADLAARTLAAIDGHAGYFCEGEHLAADRERVASDLAGLRQHVPGDFGPDDCGHCVEDWPCPDARRYADGLRRTAALYGVVPGDVEEPWHRY